MTNRSLRPAEGIASIPIVFRGPNAVTKVMEAVGHIVNERTSGETIRDTYGDYVADADGKHLMTDVWTSAGILAGLLVVLWAPQWSVLDPLMGVLSDRTRTPWGRHRPYLFAGAALAAALGKVIQTVGQPEFFNVVNRLLAVTPVSVRVAVATPSDQSTKW